MRLGERVEFIKRVARTLSEQPWPDIDLVLRQAELRTMEQWEDGGRYGYCVWSLETASADTLVELDDYLHSATSAAPGDEPWQAGLFRLFITHLAAHKGEAAALKTELRRYGIDGFVAHQDVEPLKPWQQVIEAALVSCDALVAILRTGFRESNWCDQEVGYVLGRNIPVILLAHDLQPYGFFGSLQSLNGNIHNTPTRQGKEIVRLLLRDPRTGISLTELVVDAIVNSYNYDQSNTLAPLLASDAPNVTTDQLSRLRDAQKSNSEVGEAFDVEAALRRLEHRFA